MDVLVRIPFLLSCMLTLGAWLCTLFYPLTKNFFACMHAPVWVKWSLRVTSQRSSKVTYNVDFRKSERKDWRRVHLVTQTFLKHFHPCSWKADVWCLMQVFSGLNTGSVREASAVAAIATRSDIDIEETISLGIQQPRTSTPFESENSNSSEATTLPAPIATGFVASYRGPMDD